MTQKQVQLFLSLFFCLTLSLPVLATTEGQDFSSEFGGCTVDPVFEESFYAKSLVSARVRNLACMTDSEVMGVIPAGQKIKVYYKTDGWYKVKTSDGQFGWVGATLIAPLAEAEEVKESILKQPQGQGEMMGGINKVAEKLKGFILLAVENKGEAYYVNNDGAKAYMKDGNAAFQMMRSFGLGISSANLEKVKNGDEALKNRLKGKILLAVEGKGEAFYLSPRTMIMHYLKNGASAFEVLRKEGLGIKSEDLLKIKDQGESENSIAVGEPTSSDTSSAITATANVDPATNKIKLNWKMNNLTSKMGFKVVYSMEENPVYPGDEYHYLSDPSARYDSWALPAGVYYFRVCEYLGGKCGVYSNNIKVQVLSKAMECPKWSPPSPDFCTVGEVVYGGKDENGCYLTPKCIE